MYVVQKRGKRDGQWRIGGGHHDAAELSLGASSSFWGSNFIVLLSSCCLFVCWRRIHLFYTDTGTGPKREQAKASFLLSQGKIVRPSSRKAHDCAKTRVTTHSIQQPFVFSRPKSRHHLWRSHSHGVVIRKRKKKGKRSLLLMC